MPCAGDRGRRERGERRERGKRGTLARCAAGLVAVSCLLAGCTSGGAPHHGTPRHGGPHGLPPGRHFARFLPHPIIFAGGGGVVEFIGGGGGPGGAGARPEISVPPVPPADSSLTITMPLEAYQAVATSQQETLAQAGNLLAQQCMAARGFTDTSAAGQPFTSVTSLTALETAGAGLVSAEQAKTFGFARPKGAASAGPQGPQIIGFVGQSAFGDSLKVGRAYTEALYGFSPGGAGAPGHVSCLQWATQHVYGPAAGEPVPDPVPQIAQQAVGFTQTDPRVRAAEHAWSMCMARHYYHYATPSQVEGRHWPAPPTKAEIATAVADVTCKARANLLNIWLATEAAYQQALIGRNLAALSQLQASFAPMLRRAQAALATPPA